MRLARLFSNSVHATPVSAVAVEGFFDGQHVLINGVRFRVWRRDYQRLILWIY